MNNANFNFERPENEPILSYRAGTKERKLLIAEMERMSSEVIDIPLIIGGKEIRTGNTGKVVMPHNHKHILATYHKAGEKEVQMAIDASMKAHKAWEGLSWIERVSITLKVADLISKKYRHVINASTMLGQSKNAFQAEIDAADETIDFLRFNAHYISEIYHDQPISSAGIINRIEYRPLEGFVFAVSPFNFTSISANLSLAPALMGNTIVWKPATTALLSNYYLMKIFKEAGLPDGVINFIPGSGALIGNKVLADKDLAGIHFTGSNNTFNHLWKTVGDNLSVYKSYPKLVGETGGKDFIFVHETAGAQEVATAMVRGAYEYQGQKCSAASRAYLPESLWPSVKASMADMIGEIRLGDVTEFGNFMNAVIDENSFDNIMSYIDHAKKASDAEVIFGGHGDKSVGYFIEPTVILTSNPQYKSMEEEIFGPVLTIYIYKDKDFEKTLDICDQTSPYALTGSIFSNDRAAMTKACNTLKYAAGNFYYNDKPTGAVVGQQPFGGSRASGTNDKAGSYLNLLRWTTPRTIKETLIPPTDFKYPFMSEGKCGDQKV
ncbi:MAG: L-glutamate gamma-semialdehyde dehydrogenase [Bacteroidetes bacterium]|nr:L-glutamate gamma-semialdehyde dehydrogenase [Bacteroidota bacterium]MBT3423548.1 L-glutamate gamma-semialdehyde dehydrogenase [Bacteroidota bacterium]MBT3801253.1 L-glutamate gamma-semialdehyde dehydrogenase [Bacteroidota bacterium]MBT5991594.1 L-glutamate gamma-semialdehyde dehydrogenase [Bacteroidota bacterium]MBT6834613.1 L-glutamate gamma-semialdehyde dehydrogenase [Bacteroidota bacterium]